MPLPLFLESELVVERGADVDHLRHELQPHHLNLRRDLEADERLHILYYVILKKQWFYFRHVCLCLILSCFILDLMLCF